MISINNISSHEFVGQKVTIINSSNSQIIGLNGVIIDETKSMITLDTKQGQKRFPKNSNTWRFSLSDGQKDLDGKIISKRPQDRLGVRA